jgi:hypothetical protein
MIVRETDLHFVCYTQPDHAAVSGEIALAWNRELLPSHSRFQEACKAIHHHDDAWLIPDIAPLWNDMLHQPASFMHFPVHLKLHFYQTGIDLVEKKNLYAALLISKHFSSFYKDALGEMEKQFLFNEQIRQHQLLKQLDLEPDDEELTYHFYMLQFCDDLSLFICLHEPGSDNTTTFKRSFELLGKDETIEAAWLSVSHLELLHSPLQQQVNILLKYKLLPKKLLREKGLMNCWNQTPWAHQSLTIN